MLATVAPLLVAVSLCVVAMLGGKVHAIGQLDGFAPRFFANTFTGCTISDYAAFDDKPTTERERAI